MENNPKIRQLGLAYDLIVGLQNSSFEYIYRGLFNYNIINYLLSLAETNLDRNDDTLKFKSKIYFVMVECLQNIAKHQDATVKEPEQTGMFIVQNRNQNYYITTANIIQNDKIPQLRSSLETVNSLDKVELKKYYQQIMVNGEISEKGGAGLGLIAIARKTENKLTFEFDPIDEHSSYFYLRTQLKLYKTDEVPVNDFTDFTEAKQIHTCLIKENILLNFTDTFNKHNLESLMPIIQEQMNGEVPLKEAVLKVMFEMLQNIVNYADSSNPHKNKNFGSPGIFFLSKVENQFLLTAGNYVENWKIEILSRKLDFVNNLNTDQLNDFYNKLAEFFRKGEILKPDLSIIEMKRLSNNMMKHEFFPFNDHVSFFVLQIAIS